MSRFSKVQSALAALGATNSDCRLALLSANLADLRTRVVVFGEFNRGKSTLINALLGREILRAKLVPTTGQVTFVSHSANERVDVIGVDGSRSTCPLERLDEYSGLDIKGRARTNIKCIHTRITNLFLARGLVLIDTPGVAEAEGQTRRAKQAVALADLILLVLDARQPMGEHERHLAEDWMARKLGKVVVPVLNFGNLADPEGLREVRTILDQWCRRRLQSPLGQSWYEVNALGALKDALAGRANPQIDGLRTALKNCAGSAGQNLRQRNRHSQLRAELGDIQAANNEVLSRLRTDAGRVFQECVARRAEFETRCRRFRAESQIAHEQVAASIRAGLADHLATLIDYVKRAPEHVLKTTHRE